MPHLKLTPSDVRLLKGVGIEDPEQITRRRLHELDTQRNAEAEVFDYLTGEDRAELWDQEMRARIEREAVRLVLERAEQRKRRRDRALWIAAGLLWLAAAAVVLSKGWL